MATCAPAFTGSAKRERERVEKERQKKGRETADWILKRAKPLSASHPYLAAKRVQACRECARKYRGAIALCRSGDIFHGEPHSLQFIGADGEKRFSRALAYTRCFFTLADKADGPAGHLRRLRHWREPSTRRPALAPPWSAMNYGNPSYPWPKGTAGEMAGAWEIIIAADNDEWTVDGKTRT